jgi:hypothetical protein
MAAILSPSASMMDQDDDDDAGPVELCTEAVIEVGGSTYLNGLPLIQQDLELVGNTVKVVVQKPLYCHAVTLHGLPYEWKVTGPIGTVPLTGANTLRPHFRPVFAGTYRAVLTYCPETDPCNDVYVSTGLRVDIPPQAVNMGFTVVSEVPVPPETEPVLTSWAQQPGINQVDADHEVRERKCGFPGWGAEWFTPQLVPVQPWANQYSYRLLEGRVMASRIAGTDNELNHSSHDAIVQVEPDPRYRALAVPPEGSQVKRDMEVEWESNSFLGRMRPLPGDRISAFGFHTYDCHHSDETFGILTEIHPAVMTAVHRKRPVRIPDGWQGLGNNIQVPGIVTDIWANRRAGEMTSNCSTPGLHQQAITDPPPVHSGACIQSPHPFGRLFSFNVYLPPNPQQRLAAVGVDAPPAPLHLRVEPPSGLVTAVPAVLDGITYIAVTVDLRAYTNAEFSARVVAAWVQPSQDNWGLQRWKVGIRALDIMNDHDSTPTDDGDWVLWAAVDNRDLEWTRLLNGGAVHGFHDFGGRPFETESSWADRNLGPHVQLFRPRFGDFPGVPEEDLNRSLLIHTSGYDAELKDDPTGVVNQVLNLRPWTNLSIGTRVHQSVLSDSGDYYLKYFFERVGPVLPTLTAAGRALVSAYSLRPGGVRCTRLGTNACVVLPEGPLVRAWHPLQTRVDPQAHVADWSDSPSFEPQEPEERGFTGVSFRDIGASLRIVREGDPRRVEQFFVELRRQYNGVRGTRLQGEYAKSLRGLEANLPADLWQRYFGDIDPTPVDLAVTTPKTLPLEPAAGDAVTVSARVVNHGSGASVGFNVRLYVDGVAAGGVNVPGLSAGQSTTVSFRWTALAGTHQVRVVADSLGRILEPNENDNAAERPLVVSDRRTASAR